jgi:hypothetical protein
VEAVEELYSREERVATDIFNTSRFDLALHHIHVFLSRKFLLAEEKSNNPSQSA